ncbi:hypothetical protein B0H14DRAFT_2994424 [Mycena olivaceomarginata]|nr:hypothetical protein B0H14DRAFT_2994424 [Mycena olivaceomarginata]
MPSLQTADISMPLEIHQLFAKQFAGDQRSLRQLCQVSHQWAAAAQPLLFDGALINLGLGPEKHPKEFLALLERKPYLVPSIRRIDAFMGLPHITMDGFIQLFASLDQRLPNLTSLTMRNNYLHPDNPVDTSPAGIWRNITDLELRSCTFLSDGSLFSWLFNFPHLERLTISNHINQHGETEPAPLCPPHEVPELQLKRLHLDCYFLDKFSAWISMHRGNCLIEHLCVEWDWGESILLNTFLRHIGKTVRKLKLMSQYDLRLDDIESVSFAPCPLLSSLSLSYPAGSEWHALAVLRRLNPPSYIEELVISIDLEYAITSILLSPSYRSLRTLGLKLVGKPHDGNYEKAVNHLERCSVTLRGLGVDVSFDCYMWDPLLKHAVFEVNQRRTRTTRPSTGNHRGDRRRNRGNRTQVCVQLFPCLQFLLVFSPSKPSIKPLAVILRVHRFVLMSSLSLCSDLSNLTVKPTFECCSETSGMYCCGFFFRGCRTRPNSYDVIQTALPGPRAVSNSTPTPAPPGSLLEFLKDIMGFDFSKHLPLMTARGLADIAILRTMAEWEEKPLRHTLRRLLTGSKQELGGRKGLTELELASLEYEIRKLK